MKFENRIVFYIFLCLLIPLIFSCKKAETELDTEENSVLGKWNYVRIQGKGYQNDTLTSQFAIPVNPSSFIEFKSDNTYISELILSSLQDKREGIWKLNQQTNTIILDEGIEDIDNWQIISFNKNSLQVLSTGMVGSDDTTDNSTIKLETTYIFTR